MTVRQEVGLLLGHKESICHEIYNIQSLLATLTIESHLTALVRQESWKAAIKD